MTVTITFNFFCFRLLHLSSFIFPVLENTSTSPQILNFHFIPPYFFGGGEFYHSSFSFSITDLLQSPFFHIKKKETLTLSLSFRPSSTAIKKMTCGVASRTDLESHNRRKSTTWKQVCEEKKAKQRQPLGLVFDTSGNEASRLLTVNHSVIGGWTASAFESGRFYSHLESLLRKWWLKFGCGALWWDPKHTYQSQFSSRKVTRTVSLRRGETPRNSVCTPSHFIIETFSHFQERHNLECVISGSVDGGNLLCRIELKHAMPGINTDADDVVIKGLSGELLVVVVGLMGIIIKACDMSFSDFRSVYQLAASRGLWSAPFCMTPPSVIFSSGHEEQLFKVMNNLGSWAKCKTNFLLDSASQFCKTYMPNAPQACQLNTSDLFLRESDKKLYFSWFNLLTLVAQGSPIESYLVRNLEAMGILVENCDVSVSIPQTPYFTTIRLMLPNELVVSEYTIIHESQRYLCMMFESPSNHHHPEEIQITVMFLLLTLFAAAPKCAGVVIPTNLFRILFDINATGIPLEVVYQDDLSTMLDVQAIDTLCRLCADVWVRSMQHKFLVT